MTTITPEQRRLIEQAGSEPVRLEDPETHASYVLVKEETYRKLKDAVAIEKIDPSFFEYGEFIPKQ
jgi:hypothetical protein